MEGQALLRRLAVAAAVAALALALFVLRLVVSIALLVVSAVFWLLALALGYAWLTRRRAAGRGGATR
jgi:tetrahydromethanopterin S-methyltransferase subunit C